MASILGRGFGAQRPLHRGQELVVVERLLEESVGACLGQPRLVCLGVHGAHHDDRDSLERRHRLQSLHDQIAVPCRHHQVEEDQIGLLVPSLVDRRDGIACEDRLVTVRLQPDRQQAANVLIVVDDEDLGHFSDPTLYHWTQDVYVSQVLQDPLEAGREAAGRGAWPEAYDLLVAADKNGGSLTGHDFELLSHAAMWTGHLTASIEYAERAYARYSDANEMEKAAVVALALAAEYRNKLQLSASQGWHQRAARLLESIDESSAHGFLALQRSMMASGRGDYDEALT